LNRTFSGKNRPFTHVVITGTMTQNAITIKADGGKTELVTLFNVDIQMSSGSAIKTTGQGAVTLELNGTNIAKSNTGGAGIQKMNTDWLVIQDNSTPDGLHGRHRRQLRGADTNTFSSIGCTSISSGP
jgi:hypothetical protein